MTSNSYRKMLLKQAYADERGMLLRKKIHDEYSVPQVDMADWVLQRFEWQGGEKVLDIGSGSGIYVPALQSRIPLKQYTAGDFSFGMMNALQSHFPSMQVSSSVMDVEALPFPDETFDVVLANYVLHHVEDLDKAVQEIRRVLRKPTGILIAATNSEYTMPEFNTLMQRAVRLLRQSPNQELQENEQANRFSLESGSIFLARYFKAVARHDIPSAFVFREIHPIIDYVESNRPFYESLLPEKVYWEDFMAIMSDQVRRLVEHFGELVVNKLSGVIIATDEGGFAAEYQTLLGKSEAGKSVAPDKR
jgi:SAM-dependent methyltransferase